MMTTEVSKSPEEYLEELGNILKILSMLDSSILWGAMISFMFLSQFKDARAPSSSGQELPAKTSLESPFQSFKSLGGDDARAICNTLSALGSPATTELMPHNFNSSDEDSSWVKILLKRRQVERRNLLVELDPRGTASEVKYVAKTYEGIIKTSNCLISSGQTSYLHVAKNLTSTAVVRRKLRTRPGVSMGRAVIRSSSRIHCGGFLISGKYPDGEKKDKRMGVVGWRNIYASITGTACSYSPREAQWNHARGDGEASECADLPSEDRIARKDFARE